MPLLVMKKVDRQILYLNENAYAVYIEAADEKAGDPWVRWARNFERCLPLTLWSHFGTPLSHETSERDLKTVNNELSKIEQVLRQNRTLVFPMEEYTLITGKLEATSPRLHKRVTETIQGVANL